MEHVVLLSSGPLGKNFIPSSYLPEGRDEFYLRNSQLPQPHPAWRPLRADEIERLIQNGNTADNWENVLVTDEFEPSQIRNSSFFGLVRLGRMRNQLLEHHDMQVPVGISHSCIIACDIGDDTAVHHVRYLAHYIIGSRCILLNIDEMHTTNSAQFGNGILKDGQPESARIWLDLMNEAGGRRILPFDGMIAADAYLWARYREDKELLERLKDITQRQFDSRRGYYGTVGDQCVIKNSRILQDVKIGSHGYIQGANKLQNLTINSSAEEPSQIGEGVELVNGIIGYGCHVFYGCKAVRFILGDNSNLQYGARLFHSFLGDNSTISCCEVLNNLIFPAHEQHHNNSFLIASLVLGQSNLAAGATVGSNHNSRANDGEVQAGRGFWPGLCTSVKHPSRFASFVLLSTGNYPAELDIPLPFSLLNNNITLGRLEVMPAFWWLFNLYALARNTWKFQARDQRKRKIQPIEFDYLAPDTIEEIFHAMALLERWTGKALLRREGQNPDGRSADDLAALGRSRLSGNTKEIGGLEVLGEQMEKSSRKTVILKPVEGYQAYREMVLYYAVKNLLLWMQANPQANFESMKDTLKGPRCRHWVNLGGQLIPAEDVDRLRADIRAGRLQTWQQIHDRYNQLWQRYPLDKQKHAWAALCSLVGTETLTADQWKETLQQAGRIQDLICRRVFESRKKDYENPFRKATCRNSEEMLAVFGPLEDNDFVQRVRRETEQFHTALQAALQRE